MSQPRERPVSCWCHRTTWNLSGLCDRHEFPASDLPVGGRPDHVSPVSLVEWPGSRRARGAGAVTHLTAPAKNAGEP